jgi:hypothetical protein
VSWDELVAAALLGTERREAAASVPPGAPGGLEAALAERGAEDRLLGSAAAWTVARRAGARAGERADPEPVKDDPRPVCSPAAAARLREQLAEDGLVGEWLTLAARAGVRPPPELIPDLLDRVPRLSRHTLIDVAGALGPWLGERNPRWAFAAVPAREPERVWADGSLDERQVLLGHLRRTDPARGRELLAGTLADETADDREVFVLELQHGLSDADEPLLETLLDDRRQQTRTLAARLLARLPASRLAQRMAERARPLLREQDGRLVATLPDEPDAAARRDGVPARGRRSERLSHLLGAAPLATWPLAWASLPVADDLGDALRAGWVVAATLQRNADWARVLWREDPARLLALLGADEVDALAVAADDPYEMAFLLPGQWGPRISRRFVEHVPRAREAQRRVSGAGKWLDPSVDVEPLRDLGDRDVDALCDLVAYRAAMLRELS